MFMMIFLLSMDGHDWKRMELPRFFLPKGVGNHFKRVSLFSAFLLPAQSVPGTG